MELPAVRYVDCKGVLTLEMDLMKFRTYSLSLCKYKYKNMAKCIKHIPLCEQEAMNYTEVITEFSEKLDQSKNICLLA